MYSITSPPPHRNRIFVNSEYWPLHPFFFKFLLVKIFWILDESATPPPSPFKNDDTCQYKKVCLLVISIHKTLKGPSHTYRTWCVVLYSRLENSNLLNLRSQITKNRHRTLPLHQSEGQTKLSLRLTLLLKNVLDSRMLIKKFRKRCWTREVLFFYLPCRHLQLSNFTTCIYMHYFFMCS